MTANLNKVRKQYPEYLLYGRMEKLSVEFSCGKDVIARKNGEKISVPEVIAVQWCSPDGSRAVVLTNYHGKTVSCRLDGKEITLAPLDAAVIKLR